MIVRVDEVQEADLPTQVANKTFWDSNEYLRN
jgi:hypothetical protein